MKKQPRTANPDRPRAKRAREAAGNLVFFILAILTLILGFSVLRSRLTGQTARIFGHEVYVTLSGSMAPALETGDLIFVRWTEPRHLQTGDIILFGEQGQVPTTHRLVETVDGDGLLFVTKGDANAQNDPQPVPAARVRGKVVGSIPGVGLIAGQIRSHSTAILAVLIPVALFLCWRMARLLFIPSRTNGREADKLPEERIRK